MVVQHNLRAMNSNRMLGLVSSVQSKSTEKLSSGYKINRAADDAAGLSISEKMRKQIRGLSQASLNAADGISAVQTAEGALNEVQDMLQRMNELAVKAANGTMSKDDRKYIQDEITQLETEIDRVAETTKFNESYLLRGGEGTETVTTKNNTYDYTASAAATLKVNTAEMPTSVTITRDASKPSTTSVGIKTADAATVKGYYFVRFKDDGTVESTTGTDIDNANKWGDYFNIGADGSSITLKDEYRVFTAAPTPGTNWGAQLTGATDVSGSVAGKMEVVKTNAFYSSAVTDKATGIVSDENALELGGTYFDTNGKYKGGLFAWDAGTNKAVEIGFDRIDEFVDVKKDQIYAVDASGNEAALTDSNVGTYYNTDGTLKDGVKLFKVAKNTSDDFGVQVKGEDVTANASRYVTAGVEGLYDKTSGKLVKEEELKNYFDGKTYNGGLAKYDTNGDLKEVGYEKIGTYVTANETSKSEEVKKALTFSLQVGADTTERNKITIDIQAMDAKSLGIKGLKVDGNDSTNADAAVGVIAEAIQRVSTQRSALGAVQNRLEHTIANLDNVVENTTAAESQIRDTDMATEMVKFSNNNILAQAGQAMLAQANQANQGVLSLLG